MTTKYKSYMSCTRISSTNNPRCILATICRRSRPGRPSSIWPSSTNTVPIVRRHRKRDRQRSSKIRKWASAASPFQKQSISRTSSTSSASAPKTKQRPSSGSAAANCSAFQTRNCSDTIWAVPPAAVTITPSEIGVVISKNCSKKASTESRASNMMMNMIY